jgi:tRNA A37 methylthiotransferase MiaB
VCRGYTREAYLELVRRARELIPGLAVTTDIISGFCGETEEEHRDTVSLMREVGYDQVSETQGSGRIFEESASAPSCWVGCV